MRVALLFLAALATGQWICGLASASGDRESAIANRRARARAAARALDEPFFTNGRGIHASPALGQTFRPGRGSMLPFVPVDGLLREQAGVLYDRGRPVGLHERVHRGVRVPAASCMLCHTGRAAGQTIPGLGNKTIDVGIVGQRLVDLAPITGIYASMAGPAARTLECQSVRLGRHLSDRRTTNQTMGIVPSFLAMKWVYDSGGVPIGDPPSLGVKVPHLWGYPEKARVGTFCDGFGKGIAWIAGQEIAAGQRPATVRGYQDRLHRFVAYTGELLPPRFPFPVDRDLAAAGQAVFESNCARCHGTYERDALGFPQSQAPRFVPIDVVGTDRERFDLHLKDQFEDAARRNEIADLLDFNEDRPGYLSPRLDGIWSRFPYLHNGSVPTLRDMLTPPVSRPKAWSLRDAGERRRFDRTRVGYTVPRDPRRARSLRSKAMRGARDIYWVGRAGHGNHGHPFGTRLPPHKKRALIEYLKTL